MDGASYKQIYDDLQNSPQKTIEDNKVQVINSINRFLREYPKSLEPAPDAPWVDLPVRSLVKQTLQTAIDIINDLSTLVSNKDTYSATEYRRQIVVEGSPLVHVERRISRDVADCAWQAGLPKGICIQPGLLCKVPTVHYSRGKFFPLQNKGSNLDVHSPLPTCFKSFYLLLLILFLF